MKRFSIILCTCNRAASLGRTLAALDRVVPRNDDLEIILVDNASTDETPRVLAEFAARRPDVRVVREPRAGKCIALNRAAEEASGEILVWTDDDVIPRSGWLEGLTRPILEGKYEAVVGRIELPSYLDRDWMTPDHRDRLAVIPAQRGHSLVGANMAVTRRLYDQGVGYDVNLGPGTALGYMDDILLARHLTSLGATIGLAEDGVVEHHVDASRLSREDWIKGATRLGRSLAYIAHHWDHTRISFPLLRQWKKQAELWLWRQRTKPNLDPKSEGISEHELGCIQHIAYLEQYRIESRKPHNYGKGKILKSDGD